MIKINEIFYSIQGESSRQGLPCVFIRASGCNLKCCYCDTKYAYTSGKYYSVEDILKQVEKYKINLVELTGGEPLCQKDSFELIDVLVKKKHKVLVETNGTVDISSVNKKAVIIMDIKCPSSGYSDKTVWENLCKLKVKDEIKFVILNKEDYYWAKQIIKKYNIQDKILLFSPVTGKLPSAKLAEWILKDKLNVKFHIQLHKLVGFN